jgi:hypothetical protein
MMRLTFLSWIVAGMAAAIATSLSAAEPTFKVLALAEAGGHHIAFIFMGHGPDLLENKTFTTILRNAIVWAADK